MLRLNYKKTLIAISFSVFFLIFIFSPAFIHIRSTYSQTVSTASKNSLAQAQVDYLNQKIDERNQNIKQLEIQIAKYKDLADKTGVEAKNLQATIKSLENDRKKLDLDIKKTQVQISKTGLEINKLGNQIDEAQGKINENKAALIKAMEQLRENEDTSLVTLLLSQQNLTSFINISTNLINLNSGIKGKLDNLSTAKKSLESGKAQQEQKKQELSKFATQLTDQKKVVEYTKTEQTKLLTDTKSQQSAYNKLMADSAAKKSALEKEIFDFESQIKYTLNKNLLPTAGTSPLSWPLDDIYITQYFGKTVAAKRLYVSGSHNGVDFKASIGTPVKADASGTIVGTGDTDKTCPRASFGRWILIKHDNGLASTFGHLSVISVSAGQRVNTGDIIGYSGNTGYTTGPHLHLSVYAADAVSVQDRPSAACGGRIYTMPIAPVNAYLDPMLYLPKYK